jgi:glycine/D-amino acid oxidase-like deaminating enzyme
MAEVVVIGGGVMGASVAAHLAGLGVRDVLIVDRGAELGAGSTARATGGFRAQFATEVNVRMSMLSREELRARPEFGYRPHGYLFLARGDETMQVLRDAQRVQHACGLHEARMIDAKEAQELNPAIDDPLIAGGAFCPTDGFIAPMEILRAYARDLRIEFGVEVHGLRTDGERVIALRTSRGEIAGDVFVNAVGAWAAAFGDVPVEPLLRHVLPTMPTNALPDAMPMTIWADDGFHLRVRDGRVLLLAPSFDPEAPARERVPVLRDVAVDRSAAWSGFYEMSPDHHAIVGRSVPFANLFLANGSSGHGVMHAPAIGRVVAEMIAGAKMSIDVHALRPSRFIEGEAIAGPSLL